MKYILLILLVCSSVCSFGQSVAKDDDNKNINNKPLFKGDKTFQVAVDTGFRWMQSEPTQLATIRHGSDTIELNKKSTLKAIKLGNRIITMEQLNSVTLFLNDQQLNLLWYALDKSTAEHSIVKDLQALMTKSVADSKK